MSITNRVLLALLAGVVAGLALSAVNPGWAATAASVVEPVGTLFINAIRMTVVPLVASSLIAGIAGSGNRALVARIGGRGLLVFLALLTVSGLIGALLAPAVLSRITVNPAASAALRASAPAASGTIASGAKSIQSPAAWIISLIPQNPIRAAADGTMLPIIVFSLLLGLALGTVEETARTKLVLVFRAIAEAMLVLVRWLLVIAPVGVFALALPLVARLGLAAVGALAAYVVLVSLSAALFILVVLYPVAAWLGGISLRDFARAAAPAQAVAISSRSSLAALPAMIETSRDRLHLPEEITAFFLPLASATFRVGAALGLTTGAVFIARLYGVPIGVTDVMTVVVTAILVSFSIPGIPGGSIIAMAPVLASVGLPIDGLGILLGVDTIPDMVRTTANVTGQLAAAAIVARGETRRAVPAPP